MEQQFLTELRSLQNLFETFKSETEKMLSDKDTELQQLRTDLDNLRTEGSKSFYLKDGLEYQVGGVTYTSGIITAASGKVASVLGGITVGETAKPSDALSTLNTEFIIDHQPQTLGSTNQTFIYARRPPYYGGTGISVTSGASTTTDSTKSWTTDELAGAFISVFDSSGSLLFTEQIASNTATQITIDSTWGSSSSGCSYVVFMPVYLGSADTPFRRLYVIGQDVSSGGTGAQRQAIRIGTGPTSGSKVIAIFYGTGSPESVVTANIGSLYLRTDGSTSTTLYVKTSGSSNTGWTAK